MHATIRTAIIVGLGALLLGLGGCSGGDPVAPNPAADPVDTAPPAVPTNLAAAFSDGTVKLSWDANTVDADLQGYRIYLLAFDVAQSLVDEPLARTWWAGPMPAVGACSFAVTAVDAQGNESAWQAVAYVGAPGTSQRVDQP